MHGTKPFFTASVIALAFLRPAGPAPHDACKVLTAEQFGKIMGFAATIDATGSTKMTCYYTGPKHAGGQFTILTETAGPQADAMLTRPGSSPPAGSGMVGGTYKEGSIIFSISVRSTDTAKLQALVADVRKNLK